MDHKWRGWTADGEDQDPSLIWVFQIRVSLQADGYWGVAFYLPSDAVLPEKEFFATDGAKAFWNEFVRGRPQRGRWRRNFETSHDLAESSGMWTDAPEKRADEPKMRTDESGMRTGERGVRTDKPEMRSEEPGMRTGTPEMGKDEPEMQADGPEIWTDQPEMRCPYWDHLYCHAA